MTPITDFKDKLLNKIRVSLDNNYDDNYDYNRFGAIKSEKGFKEFLRKKFINPNYIAKWRFDEQVNNLFDTLIQYSGDLNWLYQNLNNDQSKALLIDIIAFRILGHKKVRLPLNNSSYWAAIAKADSFIADKNYSINPGFLDWKLYKYNLTSMDYDLSLYCFSTGIVSNFILEQYAYKNEDVNISIKEGDIVIDAGACWGDSSLYFASKVKENGKVFSFEFIPENIEILNKNLELNNELAKVITLIKQPLWDKTDEEIYFIDNGPSSHLSFDKTENGSPTIKTTTLDALLEKNYFQKVDFIKMDIEGSELNALKGAINTIKMYKPRLAISIYHSMDDFTQIPQWIHNLGLGYKLYLGHYTIHSEETVLFAIVE